METERYDDTSEFDVIRELLDTKLPSEYERDILTKTLNGAENGLVLADRYYEESFDIVYKYLERAASRQRFLGYKKINTDIGTSAKWHGKNLYSMNTVTYEKKSKGWHRTDVTECRYTSISSSPTKIMYLPATGKCKGFKSMYRKYETKYSYSYKTGTEKGSKIGNVNVNTVGNRIWITPNSTYKKYDGIITVSGSGSNFKYRFNVENQSEIYEDTVTIYRIGKLDLKYSATTTYNGVSYTSAKYTEKVFVQRDIDGAYTGLSRDKILVSILKECGTTNSGPSEGYESREECAYDKGILNDYIEYSAYSFVNYMYKSVTYNEWKEAFSNSLDMLNHLNIIRNSSSIVDAFIKLAKNEINPIPTDPLSIAIYAIKGLYLNEVDICLIADENVCDYFDTGAMYTLNDQNIGLNINPLPDDPDDLFAVIKGEEYYRFSEMYYTLKVQYFIRVQHYLDIAMYDGNTSLINDSNSQVGNIIV